MTSDAERDDRPVWCPICFVHADAGDLRRHPTRPGPWWRCSDCGAEWSEWVRRYAEDASRAALEAMPSD
jgi:hypothetical protein